MGSIGIRAQLLGMAAILGISEPERIRTLRRGAVKKRDWDDQFAAVQAAVEGWGYEVELTPRVPDQVTMGTDRTVQINSSQHPETKFYTLLHEAGHILVRRNRRGFSRNFPTYMDIADAPMDGRKMKRKSYRVGLMAEEIEAWKRGRSLAKRMGLYVDTLKYSSDATAALMTYIEWIADISRTHGKAGRKAARTKRTARRTAPRP